MTTVTGLTAERMLAIEAASVVDGSVVVDNLILTRFDNSEIDAGNVRGPQGPMGMGPGMIPGEVRMFPHGTLPDSGVYNLWVWADGAAYLIADHPLAAAIIDDVWRTFGGASDPGGSYFRVPDFRGLTPAGMDQMPGGSAAGRIDRAEALDLAGISGEESHVLTTAELAAHDHGGGGSVSVSGSTDAVGSHSGHANGVSLVTGYTFSGAATAWTNGAFNGDPGNHSHSVSASGTADIPSDGDGDAHENMQPTVFIPYIVCLDGT